MNDSARCPECSWKRETPNVGAEVVVAVVNELEGHLAGEHDWTWQRAHEHARQWSKRLIPSLDVGGSAKHATRTAKCPHCEWTTRSHSEDLIEVSRCSSQFEAHLKSEHAMETKEAQSIAEDWALPLLQGRIR